MIQLELYLDFFEKILQLLLHLSATAIVEEAITIESDLLLATSIIACFVDFLADFCFFWHKNFRKNI